MIKEDGLPVGLGFGLAMNEEAMEQFAAMTEEEKRQVIEAARSMQSREQMQQLVQNIADLKFTP
ncbi:MAG: hypothetical protein J5986_09000 [Roseburia sp.]|nr:hypothetical protein [Roseburia sp.]